MKKTNILLLMVVFQIVIIAGMLIMAMMPLLTGTAMELEVTARDPRTLFRGNYVALNYLHNNVDLDSVPNDLPVDQKDRYHYGDIVYIEMAQKGRFYEPVGVWQNPPPGKRVLRGIVQYHYPTHSITLKAGIESYFTDPKEALRIERQLRRRNNVDGEDLVTSVVVMVDEGGHARIKSIDYPDISEK